MLFPPPGGWESKFYRGTQLHKTAQWSIPSTWGQRLDSGILSEFLAFLCLNFFISKIGLEYLNGDVNEYQCNEDKMKWSNGWWVIDETVRVGYNGRSLESTLCGSLSEMNLLGTSQEQVVLLTRSLQFVPSARGVWHDSPPRLVMGIQLDNACESVWCRADSQYCYFWMCPKQMCCKVAGSCVGE